MEIRPQRQHSSDLRLGTFRVLLVATPLMVLAAAAGVGPTISVDGWAAVVLGGPAVAVAVGALVLPTPAPPAAALIGWHERSSVWRCTVRPFLSTGLLALGIAPAEYLGAAVSSQGLRPLLYGDEPQLGWYLPLVGLVGGFLLGWVLIVMVVIPLKATARAGALWHSDRQEAVRLLVFPSVMLAVLLTGAAHIGAFPQADEGRLAMLEDELDLLFTPRASGAPAWCAVMAWVGVASLVASGTLLRWAATLARQVTRRDASPADREPDGATVGP